MCGSYGMFSEVKARQRGELRDDVTTLIEKFEAGTLTKEEFDHDAHLTIGTYYSYMYGAFTGRDIMRKHVRALNAIHGVEQGYHETITWGFLAILDMVNSLRSGNTLQQVLRAVRRSAVAEKAVLFKFFSREQLLSDTARKHVMPADKAPISREAVRQLLNTPFTAPPPPPSLAPEAVKVREQARLTTTKKRPKKVQAVVVQA